MAIDRFRPNPYEGKNWIEDRNRWSVSEPPEWWCKRLYDFDPMLVVLPSRKIAYAYVLARRSRHFKQLKDVLNRELDTAMCANYKLVQIDYIFRTGLGWPIDNLIEELKKRDTWKFGRGEKGANALVDELEYREDVAEIRKKAGIRESLWHRAGDAWRSYQARTGQRTKMNAPQPKGIVAKAT